MGYTFKQSIFCSLKCWLDCYIIFHRCVILFLENIFSMVFINGVVNYFSVLYSQSLK